MKRSLLSCCLLALALLTAHPAPAADMANTLVYAGENEDTINPVLSPHQELPTIIFSGLMKFDAKGLPVPDLAKSVDYDPKTLTYTFHLRDGIKWHDGAPFSARDVVYTYTALTSDKTLTSTITSNYQDISRISAPDERTVVIRLARVNAAMLDNFCMGILPAHLYEGHDINTVPANHAPVGTGRFKFVSWDTAGGMIVLERNTDYYGKVPSIECIVYKTVAVESTKALMLRSGEADLAWLNAKYARTFRGKDGFWLNGKPYHQLVGGNRHQDFAYVGNAMPNSQQWRDAKRLRKAGMVIVRCAHYPMDPAFMDACDELGLFVIVPTPGWQYWNKDPRFGELVHENTRNIIRRDRNHTCVLMWEPILNETRYPEDFAIKALQITKDEFPYPGRPAAVADVQSAGVRDNYDVVYDWADNIGKGNWPEDKCVFTREFGEMVDDWYAHNNINRAARSWGERPMLMAALSLCDTYGEMYHGQRQFIGGCQWHPFDHQRGYHPDTYYGGIYDAFRQKKYAFEMFRSQDRNAEPMVFIANEMTQFSDNDVTVFSNCDSVRLTMFEGDKVMTLPVVHNDNDKPCAPVVFKDFWNFWAAREYSYKQRNWQRVSLLAEGIKDGKVVAVQKKMPSRRSTKLRLYADDMGRKLNADGSDFIVVVAEVTDDNGNVKRLAKDNIYFTVEGEGRIIGDGDNIMGNPRIVEWGSAPVLIQATDKPGKITIKARSYYDGVYAPAAAELTIESVAPTLPACYTDKPTATVNKPVRTTGETKQTMTDEERQRTLEEVNKQQAEFGVQ